MKNKLIDSRAFNLSGFSGLLFCLFFIIALPLWAHASADLSLVPAAGSHIIGTTFPVAVTVNTNGPSINGGDVALTFDKSKLSVVSVDTNSSMFKMWVEYPSFSNTKGTIHFAGGVPNPGFSGTEAIITVNFKGVATGKADVSISGGGQILLNDGTGANIMGNVKGGTYEIKPAPPAVSCSVSPSSTTVNQPITFSAKASGGIGSYLYSWSDACVGTSATCSDSFDVTGKKIATVKITSGSQTASANCSTIIVPPGLAVSCTPSAETTDLNQSVTFNAKASGGNDEYLYSWSDACTGTKSSCLSSYSVTGIKTATVKVTSGSQTASASCVTAIFPVCPINESNSGADSTGGKSDSEESGGGVLSQFTGRFKNLMKPSSSPLLTEATAQNLKKVNYTATAVAIAVPLSAASALSAVASVFEGIPLFFQWLLHLLLGIFSLSKKRSPWGRVVNYYSGTPISNALVLIVDAVSGKVKAQEMTDQNGYFSSFLPKGSYLFQVRKNGWELVTGEINFSINKNEQYYNGSPLSIAEESVVALVLVVKPTENPSGILKQYILLAVNKLEAFLNAISWPIIFLGFTINAGVFFTTKSTVSVVIFFLYIIIVIAKLVIGNRFKQTLGIVSDKETSKGIGLSIIRLYDASTGRLIVTKATTETGKFMLLTSPGKYDLSITKEGYRPYVVNRLEIRNDTKPLAVRVELERE
jgi:hypothetical protein